MDAIRTAALSKQFGRNMAVNNLSLQVTQGEIFGLVGPDGAGKTTIMRLLAGIMTPTSGDAWVYGYHIVREAEALKQYISYMPQRFSLYPDLTVEENIRFYADIFNVPRDLYTARSKELLSLSGLLSFADRQAQDLSGGMKQKLALICALIHTPRILLLDEPTNGVDPLSRREFWRILQELRREQVTIFLSTSYMDEAERCDRVGLIHQGRLLACGTPAAIKQAMPGSLVEIACSRPREVWPVLLTTLRPMSGGLFGDKIHVLLADNNPATALAAVEAVIDQLGLVAEANLPPPTLEDVFMALLAPSDRGAEQ